MGDWKGIQESRRRESWWEITHADPKTKAAEAAFATRATGGERAPAGTGVSR
jgi:hypothetical protein